MPVNQFGKKVMDKDAEEVELNIVPAWIDDTDIPKMLWQQQKGVSFPTHLGISAECQDLLKRLLEPDMILRPSIEEVSWHPWLASTS